MSDKKSNSSSEETINSVFEINSGETERVEDVSISLESLPVNEKTFIFNKSSPIANSTSKFERQISFEEEIEIIEISTENSSEDSDNERTSTDNFDSLNVTYEFPEDSLEIAVPFILPKTEQKSNEKSVETAIFSTRRAMNTNNLDPCHRSASTPIKLSADRPEEDFRYDECVIKIEEEVCKKPSGQTLSEISSFNENLIKTKSDTCEEVDQVMRSAFNGEESKLRPTSGLFNGSLEQSSSSENCFANVEDNTESLTEAITKLHEYNNNNNFPMKSNLNHKIPNNLEDKVSTEQDGLSDDSTSNATAEVEIKASVPFGSQNHLKARSDVTRNKKRKCGVCKKRLNLAAITCRCGGMFCSKHRYNNEHGCTFDYKAMGAEKIKKENPQIIAEKVQKL